MKLIRKMFNFLKTRYWNKNIPERQPLKPFQRIENNQFGRVHSKITSEPKKRPVTADLTDTIADILKPKTFKRRGTGDLTEAIADILEKRSTETLKKYIEVHKEESKVFETFKAIALLVMLLVIIGLLIDMLPTSDEQTIQPVQKNQNQEIYKTNIDLYLIGSIVESWSVKPANKFNRSTTGLYEIIVSLKEGRSYHFKITDEEKSSIYTFGSSRNASKILLGNAIELNNGESMQALRFKAPTTGRYLIRLQFIGTNKFIALILRA